LAREVFEKWDSTNKKMVIVIDNKYEYDLAGNMTKKTLMNDYSWNFTYSIGYQMTQATYSSTTWFFSYDANGNLIERSYQAGIPVVVDFQATYDEYNRVKSYRFSDSGSYNEIEYDAIGRVWKRTDTSSNDTFFYHTSRALAQELDDEYNVIKDYLASSRRYMPDETADDKYRYYHKDHLGSVSYMTGHQLGTNEEYTSL
jgi:hypothetical protein